MLLLALLSGAPGSSTCQASRRRSTRCATAPMAPACTRGWQVKVNKLSSSVTQAYDYDSELGRTSSTWQKSDFKVLCKVDLTKKQAENFAKRIKDDYRVQMIMDNLPAATRMISELPDGKTVTMYDRGYRLGFVGAKEFPGRSRACRT